MNRPLFSLFSCISVFAIVAALAVPSALARSPTHYVSLNRDQPLQVAGIATLCTGVGADTQNDAALHDYTMRVQFAGRTGQYLANAGVTVSDMHGVPLVAVRCPGAWLLFKFKPGKYHLVATLQGYRKHRTVFALDTGANIILRFPKISGNQ